MCRSKIEDQLMELKKLGLRADWLGEQGAGKILQTNKHKQEILDEVNLIMVEVMKIKQ